jgi:hypothetical protein
MAIVQSNRQSGTMTLIAICIGMESTSITIESNPITPRRFLDYSLGSPEIRSALDGYCVELT